MKHPKELVLRVNEIYHDVEGSAYTGRHPEIFKDEAARWQRVGQRLLARRQHPVQILDVGSGTGFVPMQISPYLRHGDVVICSDISAGMLEVCRKNIEQMKLSCDVRYLKLDGKRFDLADESCDLVTMNSVLHHVPEMGEFLREVDRVLKIGGRVVIGHEPNRAYYETRWTRLGHPRELVGAVLRKLGIIDLARALVRRVDAQMALHRQIVEEVNERLLRERAIDQPLTVDEMTALVDVHSPTAGGFHPGEGIDLDELLEKHWTNCVVEERETYNGGATFFAIVRKNSRL